VGGRDFELDAGDPLQWAQKFSRVGPIAVVDLDAALGKGSNASVIRELVRLAECRVGGGIRTIESAKAWLDAGAASIVIGTAASPEFLKQLPRDRLIAALDAVNDQVVIEGWQTATGHSIGDRMAELREHVAGFLVTFVEREGRMSGTRMEAVESLVRQAGKARLTIAGGITTAQEIRELDRLGCDAQIGMAIYKGKLGLAEAFAAPLISDRDDQLWPTVVVDEFNVALGLAYSNLESLTRAIESGQGVYQSRSRGLWIKGETSGATQELLRVDADCDRDTLRFTVRQSSDGFCHLGTKTCWGNRFEIAELARVLSQRATDAPPESYTRRLIENPEWLQSKLLEEARELAQESDAELVAQEAADLTYFLLVKLAASGVGWDEVVRELARRHLRVTRRPGLTKPHVQHED
jgi:phosphoribosyl-ATP pyrophosphohydrolase